ncbi:VOC family protein [Wenzhouxiangella marina]|uniref:Glyoxalase/bleomycin resistance protein/dioxygenase n=1 Tax=Wenzhouxiangella marina TaxID=1579979 RepID=A0A0K0XTT1_9GAMM|nr:VOC family protein [Wenzhouxiangella marina]AKS41070.1 Glyoxalase/bleomycin resistance protein/dioxygenase [Wenzhouxiangella marina]MBB6087948.1 catechol 2,3-dioxygenase-like lactoylglutathione lyase family enzyme [Wenzhouxiangella marina]
MQLGVFSISLAVKDLDRSRAFYEKFGFEVFGGDPAHHYLMMRNGDQIIGLFQGMFDRNILTFNPGWNANCETLDGFEDVREIQRQLEAAGVELIERVDEGGAGPGHLTAIDPDGNPILIDQHVG